MTENKSEEKEEEEEKKASITIRGVDKELYEKFSRKAKELNMTVGAILNEAMRDFLSLVDTGLDAVQKVTDTAVTTIRAAIPPQDEYIVIKDIGEISLSASDLEKSEKKLMIVNVKKVIFSDDVTEEIFRKKIKSIKFADEVAFPKSVSSLTVAERCQMVKKLTQR
ncbi:MAG: hypothetical protein RXO29_00065 [Desulfurococcales archaeon]|uniref:Uncharacterized protein n=1 Tax=Fervidicoccus fontis TaxID=683846 RepID=A0A7J3SN03_9CREN